VIRGTAALNRGDQVQKAAPIVISCLAVAVIVLAVEVVMLRRADDSPRFSTTFQAVLRDNGNAYYGRLSRLGTRFPEVTDVY
jgi:hypothetical protein